MYAKEAEVKMKLTEDALDALSASGAAKKAASRAQEVAAEAAHCSAQAIANNSLIGLWLLVSNLIMAVAWGRVFYQASFLQVCICVQRVGTATLTYHVLPLLPH